MLSSPVFERADAKSTKTERFKRIQQTWVADNTDDVTAVNGVVDSEERGLAVHSFCVLAAAVVSGSHQVNDE